jgi:hypothetical protein
VRSIVLKKKILKNELCHNFLENSLTENYKNIKLTRLNNLSKATFIW